MQAASQTLEEQEAVQSKLEAASADVIMHGRSANLEKLP